jgi:CBS domain-containing protein
MVADHRPTDVPSYSSVDELIEREPLLVDPDTAVGEVARQMTDRSAAVVRLGARRFGLITDAVLRARVLVDGRPLTTPAREIMDTTVPVACLGDTAAEALMLLLERDAEFLLVTDRAGELRGVVCPRDFAISPITVGVSLHEQLRRATSIEDLATFAGRVPPVLDDLLSRGLAAARVISVYSGFLDTTMRRAIGLVFAGHPELSVDAFTWLSLGSNGRREAVLSSDVDSAVAFDDAVDPAAVRPTGRVRRGVRRAGHRGPQRGRPRLDGAVGPVLPDQRRVAGRRPTVAGRPRRAQGRDHDLTAGGRPPHPRRPGPACGEPRLQRPA